MCKLTHDPRDRILPGTLSRGSRARSLTEARLNADTASFCWAFTMPLPPERGCGRALRAVGSRCCGENALAHGLRGGWEGPSAADETGLTDCKAGSYSDGRDERDPLSAAPAGRERPPRKRPSLAHTGLSGRSLPRLFLAGRPCGSGGRRGVRRGTPSDHASPPGATARAHSPPHLGINRQWGSHHED